MKKILLSFIMTFLCATVSYAEVPVKVSELPDAVKTTLDEYFPGSSLISAERDKDDGKTKYEVSLQYKQIKLEVEVSENGQILDVEMKGIIREAKKLHTDKEKQEYEKMKKEAEREKEKVRQEREKEMKQAKEDMEKAKQEFEKRKQAYEKSKK